MFRLDLRFQFHSFLVFCFLEERERERMEQIQSALEAHLDQMTDLVHKVSTDFRSDLGPAFDNLIGFFHAINWKVPTPLSPFCSIISFFECKSNSYLLSDLQETWLMCLLAFHFLYLVTAILSRKNLNFQMLLFLTACKSSFYLSCFGIA